MEGMKETATAYYERAGEEENDSAVEFFRNLDVNGDGRVGRFELKRSSIGSWLSNNKVFKQCDGNLDFYESLAVSITWRSARAHYCTGSPEALQALAYVFFETMNRNGDGRVVLSEFLTFMQHEGYSQMRSPYFFNELDLDGNGV
ncbi:uncharacterized protein LOC105172027 [Sesamum indicum]|uniref:Uncharacterized protein LOC105172027 n=1 Tax=Sesamum indicum TaxID=4182 RepID=A0A6I9UC21_SESIN|nr:uncharacterized protein LOC105172027 [Sesamum indicum]